MTRSLDMMRMAYLHDRRRTSVLVAILRHEPDANVWIDLIDRTPTQMSVISFVETNMVMAGRRVHFDTSQVERALKALRISIVPVSLN